MLPFGLSDRGDRDLGADIFEADAFRNEFRRIDLDADCRLLLAADDDLRDAADLADLLGELRIDAVAYRGQRQRVGGPPTAAGSASRPG